MTRIYDGKSWFFWFFCFFFFLKKAGLKKHGEMRADFWSLLDVVSRHMYPSFGLFSMVGAMEQRVNAT